jgi:HK97 gp10 family phage protein
MVPEFAVELDLNTPEIEAAIDASMIETLHRGTTLMRNDAYNRCPVGDPPKHLRDSIRNEVDEEKMVGQVIVGAKLGKYAGAHAYLVEFGTAPHLIQIGEKKKTLADRRKGILFGRSVQHPGTAAQPFMRPAYDENVGRVSDIYRQAWDRNVMRATETQRIRSVLKARG